MGFWRAISDAWCCCVFHHSWRVVSQKSSLHAVRVLYFIAISIILIDVQIANKLLFPLCAEWMFVVRPQLVVSFLAWYSAMVCVTAFWCDVSASHEPSKATGVCISAVPSQGGDVSGGVINEHEKKQRRGHADGDCCTWLGEEVVGIHYRIQLSRLDAMKLCSHQIEPLKSNHWFIMKELAKFQQHQSIDQWLQVALFASNGNFPLLMS